MNVVVIDGALISDPVEVVSDNPELKAVKFTLINSRDTQSGWKKNAVFIPCVCYDKVAENALKYLSKGRKVVVTGCYKSIAYTLENGEEIFGSKIKVNEIKFCDLPIRREKIEQENLRETEEDDFVRVEEGGEVIADS